MKAHMIYDVIVVNQSSVCGVLTSSHYNYSHATSALCPSHFLWPISNLTTFWPQESHSQGPCTITKHNISKIS